jgi:hypothetical protein
MQKPVPKANQQKSPVIKRPIASPGYEHVVDVGKPAPRRPAKALPSKMSGPTPKATPGPPKKK